MRELGPITIAEDQDRRSTKDFGTSLVERLKRENVPAVTSKYLAFDVFWTIDDSCAAGDLKKVQDFIDSYTDGRLHKQIGAMTDMKSKFPFLCIEGQWSRDGHIVGDNKHGWTWDGFDNALADVQLFGGVKLIHSYSPESTVKRLADLWRWTGKDKAASWHSPVPVEAYSDYKQGVIFYDETFRNQVGTIMHWPGCGLVTANTLRENFSFMDVFGITEEGLTEAIKRWKSIKGIGPKSVAAWEAFIRA